MNQKRFCTIAVFWFCLASKLSAQTQNEDTRRLAVVRQYVDAAKFVCDKTKDGSAQGLYGNVIALLHPLRISSAFLEKIPRAGNPNPMPLGILALLQSDYQKKDLAPLFKQHLEPKAKIGGSFVSMVGTIIIVENDDSTLVKGMTLLHEAGHAATFLEKKIPFPKEETRDVIEETKIHIFEEKLWRLIGGQAYESLIVREVSRLRADAKKEGFKGFREIWTKGRVKGFSLKPIRYPELKNLVIPSTGEHDMVFRQGALSQSALFRMIDQDIPNVDHQADLTKASLMEYLHKLYGVYK